MSIFHRLPPCCVREDVLGHDDYSSLLDWALENEGALTPSLVSGKIHDPSGRRSRSIRPGINPPWRPMLVARIRELLPELFAEVGIAPFPIDQIDSELVAYSDGSFIRRHIDTAMGDRRHTSDRIISAIFYMYRMPKRFSGGALRIHPRMPAPEGMPPYRDFEPAANSLIAFPSWAIHEVLEVQCPSNDYRDSRFAINLWIRRPHEHL